MKLSTVLKIALGVVTGLCAAAALVCAFWEPITRIWLGLSSRLTGKKKETVLYDGEDGPTEVFVAVAGQGKKTAAIALGGAALLGGALLVLGEKRR